MSQPIPGQVQHYRTISIGEDGTLEPRFGDCQIGSLNTRIDQSNQPTRFTIDFSGFDATLSPLLADASGAMPVLIGTVNHSVVIVATPRGQRYEGWSGPAQSQRIGGTQRTIMRRVANRATTLECFVLCRMADGTQQFLRYFGSGTQWDQFASGNVISLTNRATPGGVSSSILQSPASGACAARRG